MVSTTELMIFLEEKKAAVYKSNRDDLLYGRYKNSVCPTRQSSSSTTFTHVYFSYNNTLFKQIATG